MVLSRQGYQAALRKKYLQDLDDNLRTDISTLEWESLQDVNSLFTRAYEPSKRTHALSETQLGSTQKLTRGVKSKLAASHSAGALTAPGLQEAFQLDRNQEPQLSPLSSGRSKSRSPKKSRTQSGRHSKSSAKLRHQPLWPASPGKHSHTQNSFAVAREMKKKREVSGRIEARGKEIQELLRSLREK